jgi:hypothetical protein
VGLIATVTGIEWDLIPRPAAVRCDICGHYYQAGRKFMDPGQRLALAEALRAVGWQVEGDHERHVCPQCVWDMEDSNG